MGVTSRFHFGGARSGKSLMAVRGFFDAPAIMSAVDRAAQRILSRFGSFVRRTARQSIRRPRKKRVGELSRSEKIKFRETGKRPLASSKPGQPPRSPTGKLKNTILYWYDAVEQSVTIGPARLRAADNMGALEKGGRVAGTRGRGMTIRARPFMGPALAKELPKLDDMWRNSVRS